jgi:Na+/proline symporter
VIPIVLGIFGYTYGSLLGVFLVGMLTKTRGSETGNLVAMVCGFIVVAVLSGLHNDLWNLLHPSDPDFLAWMAGHPKGPAFQHWHWDWLPTIDFPWRITAGTLVTAAVALIFRTPPERVTSHRKILAARGRGRRNQDHVPGADAHRDRRSRRPVRTQDSAQDNVHSSPIELHC